MWGINTAAVLVAAVASMIVGFAWYSPKLFGKVWMAESGMTSEKIASAKQGGMSRTYFLSFVGSVITAYLLAVLVNRMGITSALGALKIAVVAWLAFVMPVQYNSVLYGQGSNRLFLINTGHILLSLVVMALVVVLWQ